MKFAFELSINALESFLILEFLAQYFGYRVSAPKKYYGSVLLWAISFLSISFFSWNFGFESASSCLQIVINFIFCAWLLRESRKNQLFISIFTMCCVMLTALFTAALFGNLPGHHLTTILNEFGSIRMIAVLTSKVLFFQITRVILRIRKNTKLERAEFFPLVVLPILSIVVISILMTAVMDVPEVQNLFFLAICILMVSNILTYYLFIQLGKSAQMKQELELLNLQYDCARKNAEDIQSLYDRIRAAQHDMSNHLSCIASMLNGRDGEAQRYIKRLLEQQDAESRTFVFSGNTPLDAIINLKEAEAYKNNISFESMVLNSLEFMAPEDICVLLGNMLDNALEAARFSDMKKISIQIVPQGEYVSLVVRNSIADSVLQKNPDLHTTKGNRLGHGFGIRNIRRMVQRYNGMVDFFEEGHEFTCDILLRNTK